MRSRCARPRAAVHPNFPPADTVLIVELDGPRAEVQELFVTVEGICRRAGATVVEVAATDEQRARIWKGRKAAFAAMGRISPNYYVQDGVVPRTKLPEVLARIRALSEADGSWHRQRVSRRRRQPAPADLLRRVGAGAGAVGRGRGRRDPLLLCGGRGSITGEHGVGATSATICRACSPRRIWRRMQQLRDALDPHHLCNPGNGATHAAVVWRECRGRIAGIRSSRRELGERVLMDEAVLRRPGTPADAVDGVVPVKCSNP
jgi:glycolate oxidase